MAKLEIRITQIYRRGKRGFSKSKTFETGMGLKQAKKRIWAFMENPIPVVVGDPVADYWISEIQEKTGLTLAEVLNKVHDIQKFGDGSLVSTNSYRVAAGRVADHHDVKLTDGSNMGLK